MITRHQVVKLRVVTVENAAERLWKDQAGRVAHREISIEWSKNSMEYGMRDVWVEEYAKLPTCKTQNNPPW